MKVKCLALSIVALLVAQAAHAATIDFQDVVSANCNFLGTSAVSRGFTFTGNPADSNMFACNAGAIQHNTTVALINANQRSIVNMSPTGGGTFSLESFFAGGRTSGIDPNAPVVSFSVATSLDVVGNLFGGGTVSTSFVLDSSAPYDWQQFLLPGTFTNLTSVVMTAHGAIGADVNPEFLIDDIVVNSAAAAVPEPQSLALLGMGLVIIARKCAKKVRS